MNACYEFEHRNNNFVERCDLNKKCLLSILKKHCLSVVQYMMNNHSKKRKKKGKL